MNFKALALSLCFFLPLLPQEPTQPTPDTRAVALTKMLEGKSGQTSVIAAVLHTPDSDKLLEGMQGGFATTYAFITILFYSDFPELSAPTRTTCTTPTILVHSVGSPRGKLFLVKVEVNKRKGNRSLKMGNSGYGSVSNIMTPDQDWVIPSTVKEVSPEIWEFKPLKVGEYGIFATLTTASGPGGMGGELFDFGVDKP